MYVLSEFISVIDNPYGCCGKTHFDRWEDLENDYWDKSSVYIDAIWNDIYAAEIYGKNTEEYYNLLGNFVYFLALMKKIYYDNVNYYAIHGVTQDAVYYNSIYNFDCIRKTFRCNGCEILPMLAVFDMDYVNTTTGNKDGIGYMAIIPNAGTSPDNRIF